MRFTEDRISHIAHLVWDALYNDDLVDYPDEDKALLGVKAAIHQFFHVDDEIDDLVRKKIQSLKRGVTEGTREWEILYTQYYEEEANRRRY
jgi:hypothetical protein